MEAALLLLSLTLGGQNPKTAVDLGPPIISTNSVIGYLERPVDDAIARLQKQLDTGQARLTYDAERWGYLPGLLKQLGINTDSQLLVFSKTSFQAPKITPKTPRAVFFNDTVSIGSVQDGAVLEITALDPKQGIVFYSLDVHESAAPKFKRENQNCLVCHQGEASLLVPGLMISSVLPGPDGTPAPPGVGDLLVDHRTPFEDRWGGWYVTGTHGTLTHRGNAIAPDPARPGDLETENTLNLTRLDGKLDVSRYLEPTSDLVALMTLEHQCRMSSLITRAGWQARAMDSTATSSRQLDALVEELVAYMLFADEAPLSEPIMGVSSFTHTFPKRGPRDRQGRSLRDFDLSKRLFKYPLSYMIYSEAFDALPPRALDRIYKSLFDILTNHEAGSRYRGLNAADRQSILEIVRETKTNLPAYWDAP